MICLFSSRLSSEEALPPLVVHGLALSPARGVGAFRFTPLCALGCSMSVVLVPCVCVPSSPYAGLSHFLFLLLSQSRQICPLEKRDCSLRARFFWVGDDENVDDEVGDDGNIFTTCITIMSP